MRQLNTVVARFVLGAALALCGLAGSAWARGVPVDQASPEQTAAARAKFVEADAAAKAGRHEEALRSFRASYDIVASPNTHLRIVDALEQLGRSVEVYREAQAVATEADAAAAKDPKYQLTAQTAREWMQDVRLRIGLVTVRITLAAGTGAQAPSAALPAGAALTVAGRSIPASEWDEPVPVDPGVAAVVLSTETGTATREVTVEAGVEAVVELALPQPEPKTGRGDPLPPPPPEPEGEPEPAGVDLQTVAFIAGGVGVAGFVSFAVFGALAQKEYDDLAERCPPAGCPAEQSSEADTGRTYQTVANVSVVVGAVGLAAGVTLLLVDVLTDSDETETAHPTGAPRAPVVSVGPGSLSIRGEF